MLARWWEGPRLWPCCAMIVIALTWGCDWDRYDPRLAADAGVGGQSAQPLCGRIQLLADDFESAELAEQWVTHAYGAESSAAQAGGQVVVITGAGGYDEAYVGSRHFYDFREGAVSVEVTQVPDTATDATTQLIVQRDDSHRVMLQQRGGNLRFVRQIGSAALLGTVAYDAAAHRFWQIRNEGETLFWETSPDGSDWQVQQEHPLSGLFDLENVRVRLHIHENAALGGEARFDNLESSGPGDGVWCPAGSLSDDFADDERGDAWLHTTINEALVRQYDGQLVGTLVPNVAYAEFTYVASKRYDMTGSGFGFELVEPPTPPAVVRLHASSQSGQSIQMTMADDTLSCTFYDEDEPTEVASLDYSPAAHRWWRFREEEGTLVWEGSADGTKWNQLALQSPNPLVLDRMSVRFGVSTPEEHPNPKQVTFDNFNFPPRP